MVQRSSGESRPDHTTSIVGEEGIPVRQDRAGVQIQRLGVAGADADWGPEQVEITNDEVKIAQPDRVGGTREFSGIVNSLDGQPCSVAVVWNNGEVQRESIAEAENCDKCIVERPEAAQGDTEHLIKSIKTKGDNCWIFVEDDSPQDTANNVEYTVNFH